jgi:hypothetical protein
LEYVVYLDIVAKVRSVCYLSVKVMLSFR